MESLYKLVARQDANFKLSPSSSNETSINLSKEISDFVSNESGKVTFTLHKSDFVRALSSLCLLPAIYHKKEKAPSSNVVIFDNLSRQIDSQFGSNDTAEYTINLYKREDGRAYFNDLKSPNGFNLRAFLVEQYSTVAFQKIDGQLHIRLYSDKDSLPENEELVKASDDPNVEVSNSQIGTLAAVRTKPFLLLAGISGTGKSRVVRKLAQATVTEYLQREYEDSYTWEIGDFPKIRWNLHRPANFELIQVKPNWHNSMDVVGYLSNIPSPHYVFTPFINFIVRAMCHPEVPFFLCLDEMNLAPVEEYFAEFLSAIESRAKVEKLNKDGEKTVEYMTDPIISPFKTYGKVSDEGGHKNEVGNEMRETLSVIIDKEVEDSDKRKKIKDHLWEKGLTLPENLIIVGTVNMDETTFSFSRKVLDRAMSMEMNKVDYSSFLFDTTDDDIKAIASAFKVDEDPTGENNALNRLLVDRHVEAKEVVKELGGAEEGSDARFVIDYLETINRLLDGTPFKLGYRAANEALIYLRSSQEFGNSDRKDAMDKFTLMKILSRIEGDESKLKLTDADSDRLEACGVDFGKISNYPCGATLLSALREIISEKLGGDARGRLEDHALLQSSDGEDADGRMEDHALLQNELESVKKLDAMIGQLDRDHFVSYWS